MAAVARSKGIDVEVAHFEHWADAGRRFDLVTAGQSWHWVAPEPGAAKAARVLRDGGRLALFWNFSGLPPPLRADIEAVYARLAPAIAGSTALGHYVDRGDHAADALGANRDFEPAERHTFVWSRIYTTAQWIAQLPTHSDHQTLPEAELRPLLDAVAETIAARGGAFEMTYQVVLITARRRSRAGSDRAADAG